MYVSTCHTHSNSEGEGYFHVMSKQGYESAYANRPITAATSPPGIWLSTRPHVASGIVLGVLVGVVLGPHLFSTSTILYGWDVVHEKYYWRAWGFGQLREGQVPLWNSYVLCGFPFIVDPIQGMFYPLNILFLVLPISLAFAWTVGLHVWLGSYCSYRYVQRITDNVWAGMAAAIVFGFCGFQGGRIYLGSIPQLCTMAWLPCLFCVTEWLVRKPKSGYAALLSLTVGLQFLSGHLQFSFYNLLAVGFYGVFRACVPAYPEASWRERLAFFVRFCLSMVLGIGIACVMLFPLAHLKAISIRTGGGGHLFQQLGPFPPDQLITFVAPEFFGNELTRPYWGDGIMAMHMVYVGIFTLLLGAIAICGVRRRPALTLFFVILVVCTMLLAMGRYVPGFVYVYKYVPGFKLFRFISRWISVASFGSAVIAGIGLAALFETTRSNTCSKDTPDSIRRTIPWIARLAIVGGCALGLSYAVIPWLNLGRSSLWRDFVELGPQLVPKDVFTAAFVMEALDTARRSLLRPTLLFPLCGMLLYLWVFIPHRRYLLGFLTLACLFLDLWSYESQFIIRYPLRYLEWDPRVVSLLTSDPEPYRVESWMPVESVPLPGSAITTYRHINRYNQSYINRGMVYGIANVGGLFSLTDRRYMEFALGDPWYTFENYTLKDSKTADMLNVRYLIAPPGANLGDRQYEEILRTPSEVVYRNPNALPRAYIVHEVMTVHDETAALELLRDPSFEPRKAAVMFGPQRDIWLAECPYKEERAVLLHQDSRGMVIQAELACAGLLVVSEANYPGWRCTVDGKETPIETVNYVFRGIYLEPGSHMITFSFVPRGLMTGAAISVCSASVALLWCVWGRRRTSRADRVVAAPAEDCS